MQPSTTVGRKRLAFALPENRFLALALALPSSIGRSTLSAVAIGSRLHTRTLAVAVATSLLSACGGGGEKATAPPVPVLTTLTVTLSATTLQIGQSASASASGADQTGGSMSTGTVTWASSSTSVATISASGAISALAAGQTTITGTAGGKSGQASLTVTPIPLAVASVTVSPATVSIVSGGTQQFTATTLDANGAVLMGRTVTWSTSSTLYAPVSPAGLVTIDNHIVGTVVITATSEGKSGWATVTVVVGPAVRLGFGTGGGVALFTAVAGTPLTTLSASEALGGLYAYDANNNHADTAGVRFSIRGTATLSGANIITTQGGTSTLVATLGSATAEGTMAIVDDMRASTWSFRYVCAIAVNTVTGNRPGDSVTVQATSTGATYLNQSPNRANAVTVLLGMSGTKTIRQYSEAPVVQQLVDTLRFAQTPDTMRTINSTNGGLRVTGSGSGPDLVRTTPGVRTFLGPGWCGGGWVTNGPITLQALVP